MYRTATNRQTGERVILIGEEWKPVQQSATSKDGRKAYLVEGAWLTDDGPSPQPEAPPSGAPATAPAISTPTGAPEAGSVPEWGRRYPVLYGVAGAARETLGPILEGVLSAGGGLLGTSFGPAGTVAGAGAGYATGTRLTKMADIALGNEQPETLGQAFTNTAKDALIGATLEAGGQVVAPIIGRGVAKVIGRVGDIGRSAEIKAGRIMRQALGPNIAQARKALQQGGNLTAAQLTSDINSPAFHALNKLAAGRNPAFFGAGELTPAQVQEANALLTSLAGGKTQTAARIAQEKAVEQINNRLIPVRDVELGAANIAGKIKPKLDAKAAQMANAATEAVGDVRRFTAAAERTTGVGGAAHTITKPAGQPRVPGRYTYLGELGAKAEEVAQKAASASLDFGEAARFASAASKSLEAHGLRPLTVDSIETQLMSALRDPKYAGNREVKAVIERVIKDARQWSDAGGVIDAFALDAIRKNSVNGAVAELLGTGANTKLQREVAAKVLKEVKPAITAAIEKAGGTGYGEYLRTYATARQAVDQKKLSAEALRMFESNPQEFAKLVRGNNPQAVEEIFGPGSYNIAQEMAKSAHSTMRGIARVVESSAKSAAQASTGQVALQEILENNISKFKVPWGLSPKAAVLNRGLALAEKKIGKQVMTKIAEGMKSGRSAVKVLDMLPTAEKNQVLKALSDPEFINLISPKGTKAATISATSNAFVEDRNNTPQ